MAHEQYIELMSAALDGELSAGERRELDAHLARCPECAALFRELSEQSAALRSLDCDVPENLRVRILSELPAQEAQVPVHEVKNRPRTETGGPGWRRWAGIAACAALVAAIGGAALLHGTGTSAGPDVRSAGEAPSEVPMAILEEPGALVEIVPSVRRDFTNSLYLRVTWGVGMETPSARIIGSADSLAAFAALFPEDDLSAVTDAYGDSFFETRRLLAVVLEEPSGSIRHELVPGGLTGDSVTVLRKVPEAGTADMAAWLIFAEVGPEFSDGDVLGVVFQS